MSIRWCDLPTGSYVVWPGSLTFFFKLDTLKHHASYNSDETGVLHQGYSSGGHMHTGGLLEEYEKTLTFLPVELLL